MDVNVVVPMGFYGTYAAHTSYLMYTSSSPEVYDMHRSLRYLLDSLMRGELDAGVPMALDVLPCPEHATDMDAANLFSALLQQGLIWIGFRVDTAIVADVLKPNMVMRLFPRRHEFQCLRQLEIMINPLGNPQSLAVWNHQQAHIVELIVIRRR